LIVHTTIDDNNRCQQKYDDSQQATGNRLNSLSITDTNRVQLFNETIALVEHDIDRQATNEFHRTLLADMNEFHFDDTHHVRNDVSNNYLTREQNEHHTDPIDEQFQVFVEQVRS
jgi:hypothetical protein